jgi:hypothetical protein
MRVLIAIEPRSYREVIGQAIQAFKPHLEVAVVEPEDLWVAVERLAPDLIFADRPNYAAAAGRSPWVEFRPYEEPPAKIWLGGRYRELEEVEFSDLLSVVDEAEELARTRRHPGNS